MHWLFKVSFKDAAVEELFNLMCDGTAVANLDQGKNEILRLVFSPSDEMPVSQICYEVQCRTYIKDFVT